MDVDERGLTFECGGARLVSVIAAPSPMSDLGVLVVVGGPQYRVGSHRQFVLLARALAGAGFATMRFDYRGMGDSEGQARTFEDVDADIACAIDAFVAACPGTTRVVLWGLCDAASAALMYVARRDDPRIAGVALFNPWVRSDATVAKARIRHYYLRRLVARDFWAKALRGGIALRSTTRGIVDDARRARRASRDVRDVATSFQAVMERGLREFDGAVLVVLSGRDLTAQEFLERARAAEWAALLARPNVVRCDLPESDHTFSSADWRSEVERVTIDWLRHRVPAP